MDRDSALEKLRRYCVSQDRCHSEVRNKLLSLQVYGYDLEDVMSELIQEDFLNEERFARSYVRGKFRMNQWGRNKILSGLKAKRISEYCIRKGMEEIDVDEYRDTLYLLLTKKNRTLETGNRMLSYKKLLSFGLQKGYEYDEIKNVANGILDE